MNEQCVSPKTFDCECKAGFFRNEAGSCADVDECSAQEKNCHPKANCENTSGSYQCNCNQGYYGNGEVCLKGQCVDSNCLENQVCSSPSTLDCKCKAGYIAKSGSNSCIDFDECAYNDFDCEEYVNTECKNTVGSYDCVCRQGFFKNGGECTKPMDVLVTHSWWATIVIDSTGNKKTLEEGSTASGFVSTGCFKKDPDVRKLLYCGVTWKNEMYLYGNQRIAHLHGYKFSVVDQNFNFYRGACSAINDEFIFLCFNIVEDMDKECRRATDPLGYFTEVAPSNKYHKRIPISASESK